MLAAVLTSMPMSGPGVDEEATRRMSPGARLSPTGQSAIHTRPDLLYVKRQQSIGDQCLWSHVARASPHADRDAVHAGEPLEELLELNVGGGRLVFKQLLEMRLQLILRDAKPPHSGFELCAGESPVVR